MDKSDISPPIVTILDGSNYTFGSQSIKSFLIGYKLWHPFIGDISKHVRDANESDIKYIDRIEY